MIISRQAVFDYEERHFDSFLWMKRLSKDRLLREIESLKVKPRFKTDPWLHQLVCFWIGLHYPQFLFLLDMGLGKSKIIMDLITQIQRERRLEGALVFVPRLSNIDSWQEDLLRHSDLEPNPVLSGDAEEKYETLLKARGDVTFVDYHGFHLAMSKKVPGKKKNTNKLAIDENKVKAIQKQYNLIAIDESHKLKNHQGLWFNLVNRMTRQAEFCYAMTGTLFGKDVEAVWSQFRVVDQGETFGENLGLFRATFFTEKFSPWRGTQYVYNPRKDDLLRTMIGHRSLRYDETEVNDLPSRVYRMIKCSMGEEQREHYMRALEGLVNAGGNLRELDGAWLRMRQITSGYLCWEDKYGKHVKVFADNPKLDLVERLLDEMGDSKIVICYDYTETGKMICERVKSLGIGYEWFYGGTPDKSASRRRFLDDPKCRVFVMNSEAGGTGNDGLQRVARYMVFYETPTPPTTRKQTEKRLHRPGQEKRVFIYDLVMRRSSDKKILDDIAAGIDRHVRVVDGGVTDRSAFLSD